MLELFKVGEKIPFTFDDENLNFLYTHGVIDYELESQTEYMTRFSSPFVQKRLFNYFARQLFPTMGSLFPPFTDLSAVINEHGLQIKALLKHYERYLQTNRDWLFKEAPRRSTDLRIFEAVYHFNLFTYLSRFLDGYGGRMIPEFPTGNGQIDLLIHYAGQRYGLEIKSFASQHEYNKALRQSANYAQQLGLHECTLLLFVEAVDDENQQKYEVLYEDPNTGVKVEPVFVTTG